MILCVYCRSCGKRDLKGLFFFFIPGDNKHCFLFVGITV